jgi:hypothetical protein
MYNLIKLIIHQFLIQQIHCIENYIYKKIKLHLRIIENKKLIIIKVEIKLLKVYLYSMPTRILEDPNLNII